MWGQNCVFDRVHMSQFHVTQFYMWRVILGLPPVDVGRCWEEVSEVFALGGVVSGGGALCLL